eukprot:7385269-Prymnesium_polylepis.2
MCVVHVVVYVTLARHAQGAAFGDSFLQSEAQLSLPHTCIVCLVLRPDVLHPNGSVQIHLLSTEGYPQPQRGDASKPDPRGRVVQLGFFRCAARRSGEQPARWAERITRWISPG